MLRKNCNWHLLFFIFLYFVHGTRYPLVAEGNPDSQHICREAIKYLTSPQNYDLNNFMHMQHSPRLSNGNQRPFIPTTLFHSFDEYVDFIKQNKQLTKKDLLIHWCEHYPKQPICLLFQQLDPNFKKNIDFIGPETSSYLFPNFSTINGAMAELYAQKNVPKEEQFYLGNIFIKKNENPSIDRTAIKYVKYDDNYLANEKKLLEENFVQIEAEVIDAGIYESAIANGIVYGSDHQFGIADFYQQAMYIHEIGHLVSFLDDDYRTKLSRYFKKIKNDLLDPARRGAHLFRSGKMWMFNQLLEFSTLGAPQLTRTFIAKKIPSYKEFMLDSDTEKYFLYKKIDDDKKNIIKKTLEKFKKKFTKLVDTDINFRKDLFILFQSLEKFSVENSRGGSAQDIFTYQAGQNYSDAIMSIMIRKAIEILADVEIHFQKTQSSSVNIINKLEDLAEEFLIIHRSQLNLSPDIYPYQALESYFKSSLSTIHSP